MIFYPILIWPLCFSLCTVKLLLKGNDLWHISYAYRFSPVCMSRCTLKLPFSLFGLSHRLHTSTGFRYYAREQCIFNWPLWLNDWSQTSPEYGFSPVLGYDGQVDVLSNCYLCQMTCRRHLTGEIFHQCVRTDAFSIGYSEWTACRIHRKNSPFIRLICHQFDSIS